MVSLHHEIGWVIDLQDTIDALWEGTLAPKIETVWPNASRMVGYVDRGKEVLFDE
jgi:hypothetical protein